MTMKAGKRVASMQIGVDEVVRLNHVLNTSLDVNAALRKRIEELEEEVATEKRHWVEDNRDLNAMEEQIAALISAGEHCGLAISHNMSCPVICRALEVER